MLSWLDVQVFADGLWNLRLSGRVGECSVNWAQSLFSKSVGLKEREGMLNHHLECHLMPLDHVEETLMPPLHSSLGTRSLVLSGVLH